MYADKETIELLDGMAGSRTERHQNSRVSTNSVPDRARSAGAIKQHFDGRKRGLGGSGSTLNHFLSVSVFRAGLQVQCPICAYHNWYDLDAITYRPTCTQCLKQFEVHQTPEELKKIKWYYRVVGPFAAPGYARGGYAVALTLRCLAEDRDGEMTWATGLELKELGCEVDFAAWQRSGRMLGHEADEPSFVVGEAKSFARHAIDERATTNLRAVGERVPGCFLVVSTMKRIADYQPDEIGLLRSLAMWVGPRCQTASRATQ